VASPNFQPSNLTLSPIAVGNAVAVYNLNPWGGLNEQVLGRGEGQDQIMVELSLWRSDKMVRFPLFLIDFNKFVFIIVLHANFDQSGTEDFSEG
jgi:hypothetical protein